MRPWSAPALPPSWATTGVAPLVARRAELDAVRAAYGAVETGAGRAVFISGAPGTGKSRLLAAACTELHNRGAAVLAASCVQEYARPLEPFDQALLPLLDALDEGSVSTTEAVSTADGPGERRPHRDGADLVWATFASRGSRAIPTVGPDRLFDEVVQLLAEAARSRPVVLALDDLHWAGDDAIRLLGQVVSGIADARVLVLGAYRADPPDRSVALLAAVSRLGHLPYVDRLPLAPFTRDGVAEYLERFGGLSTADADQPAGTIMRVTGGNPFLVGSTWPQLLTAMRGGGRVDLPDSAIDLLRPRIAMLDPAERDLLEVAAVLGETVDVVELLAIGSGTPDRDLAAFDAIVRAGLLESPVSPESLYRFPHAIARQAVLDQLPPSEAMRVHARIAQTLEARFPAAPRLLQRLAHHYSAARALGFADRAVTYLIRSAESADVRLAHVEAAHLFEQAAALTGRADERDQLRARSARSWSFASDFARAREQHLRTMSSEDARTRLRAAIGYEDASWRPGLPGARAAELLTTALAGLLQDERDPLVIEGLASLGRATAYTGDLDEGAVFGDRAVALARALGDQHTLAAALRARVWHTLRPDGLHERMTMVEELHRLVADLPEDWTGLAGIVLSHGSYVLGDAAGMARAEQRLATTARRWGAYWNYWIECARFGRALATGALGDAEAYVARIGVVESGFRSDVTTGAGAVQSFMVRRETGRLGVAAKLITGAESPTSNWAPGLLALYTELGMTEPSRRVLHWLLEHDDSRAHRSGDWPAHLAFMVEAAVALRDADAGRVLRPLLLEYSGLNLLSGFHVAPLGPADRYLGELDVLCGSGDPAAAFARGIHLAETLGAPLHLAYSLASAAAFERAAGDAREARSLEARARSIGESLGLVRLLGRMPAGVAAPAAGGLTARETEVLRLLAAGLSNREIAGELVISEHTAANHVRNILTKVGAANRTRAARFAREHGIA
jgi:DNA-binding CsgD family transcriptional regulator